MKIALVTPYDYPYPGGVTEHIKFLDRHFRAWGHDTRIIAASSADADELGDHIIKVSGTFAQMPFSGSRARISVAPIVYRRVKKILIDEQFDIVHVHEPAVPILSLVVLRHSHAVNVGTFHAYRESNNPVYEVMGALLRRTFRRLDGRIAVSSVVCEYLAKYFPGECTIIPNGIDCSRYSPNLKPIERYDDGRPNILYVGRMDARKGFRHLMRAFPRIKEAIPDARLIVVGAFSDQDKAPFVRYARIHKIRGVHFVGYVPPEELPRFYRTATVFCAPSTGFESFGIVLLEAMASGVPIVASKIAGYCTVLEDGREGALVPPGDDEAIVRTITALLRDPARRAQMGEDGRKKAAQYDWDIIARQVLDFYSELLAQRAAVVKGMKPRKRFARVRNLLNMRGARGFAR